MVQPREQARPRPALTPGGGRAAAVSRAALVLAAIFALAGARAAAGAGGEEPSGCDVKKVGLDAAQFHRYLTEDTPYWKWERVPGTEAMQPGGGYHGAYATIYANPTALASIRARTGMAPGSLLVLESFDESRQPGGFCAMLRIRGFEPGAGDWHWSRYDVRGNAEVSGRAPPCLDCHGGQSGNDYVFSTPVRE